MSFMNAMFAQPVRRGSISVAHAPVRQTPTRAPLAQFLLEHDWEAPSDPCFQRRVHASGEFNRACGKLLPEQACRRQIIAAIAATAIRCRTLRVHFSEGISMTLPISSTSVAAALPALSGHAHGHGHKKGGLSSLTDSTDATDPTSSSSTAADASSSTTNLFSSLMTSIEQVIGTQPAKTQAPTAAIGQTNTQVAPSTSVLGNAAKSALQIASATPMMGAIGTALKLFA
jgi:hypothetical protein